MRDTRDVVTSNHKPGHVSENYFGLSIFEHRSETPSKYGIPKPNGYHQWIRAEALPLESVLQVWKGPFQVLFI